MKVLTTLTVATLVPMSLPAQAASASFELIGRVPVSCSASVAHADLREGTLQVVITEDCNTWYNLRMAFPEGSRVSGVSVDGTSYPVRDGTALIARTPFSGSATTGSEFRVEFSEAGAAEDLKTLHLEAIARS